MGVGFTRRFGAEKGKAAGPDRATTTVGEDMQFKVSAGNQKVSLGRLLHHHACAADRTLTSRPFIRPNPSKTRTQNSKPNLEPRRSPVVSVRETISPPSVLSRIRSRVLEWEIFWVENLLWTIRLLLQRPCPVRRVDPSIFLREFSSCDVEVRWLQVEETAHACCFHLILAALPVLVHLDRLENPCSTETETTSPPSELPRSRPKPTRMTSERCLDDTDESHEPTSLGIETRRRARDSRLSVSRAGPMEKRLSRLGMDEVSRERCCP